MVNTRPPMLTVRVGTVPGATAVPEPDELEPVETPVGEPEEPPLPPGARDSVSTTKMRGRWAS